MIKVLIVDDQLVPQQLFSSFIHASGAYELAATLSSAEKAVEYCRHHPVDLILMDVVFVGGMNGLAAAGAIKRMKPEIKIIMVTSMPEVSYLEKARRLGVESFWYKEVQEQPLLCVMDRTMAGESVYPDTTPELILGNASSLDLTPTELAVLREVTTGATNKEISQRLGMSVTTVNFHLQNLLQKTGYKNRVQLAVKARVEGLVIGDE